jgi:hypothetical protein
MRVCFAGLMGSGLSAPGSCVAVADPVPEAIFATDADDLHGMGWLSIDDDPDNIAVITHSDDVRPG